MDLILNLSAMEIKSNYITIPLLVIIVAAIGSSLTANGMYWYNFLRLPDIVPNGNFIGTVWTIIYVLATISVILFWNAPRRKNFKNIAALFLLNAVLNVLWSYIFFILHLFWWAIAEMIILNLTTIFLIFLLWRYQYRSALLLVPYVIWVTFATYLAYLVASLN